MKEPCSTCVLQKYKGVNTYCKQKETGLSRSEEELNLIRTVRTEKSHILKDPVVSNTKIAVEKGPGKKINDKNNNQTRTKKDEVKESESRPDSKKRRKNSKPDEEERN
ncbi:hypothetical protein C2G38_2232831 [Gigaspora rosea]|uniref:Uncharacterized protein n=1 Tax=Gigaspora rosea TaxID=44941 RepID=A0A397TS30_9GLOM|nr:hypothetical protein C2G38_2232831 [Gigaspora rosea]